MFSTLDKRENSNFKVLEHLHDFIVKKMFPRTPPQKCWAGKVYKVVTEAHHCQIKITGGDGNSKVKKSAKFLTLF